MRWWVVKCNLSVFKDIDHFMPSACSTRQMASCFWIVHCPSTSVSRDTILSSGLIDWARFNIPPNTLWVMSGIGSFKALNEDRVLRIRLQSHQVHPTTLIVIQQLCIKQKHTKYTQISTNKSTHGEMGLVWQNPIQRIVRTVDLSVLMTVHNFSTQYNTEQFW